MIEAKKITDVIEANDGSSMILCGNNQISGRWEWCNLTCSADDVLTISRGDLRGYTMLELKDTYAWYTYRYIYVGIYKDSIHGSIRWLQVDA